MSLDNQIIIGIDTGNKSLKTENTVFNAGLSKSATKPMFNDYIYYNGDYYSVSEERLAYTHKKHEKEEFFILTLFGIAKELIYRNLHTETACISIMLGVGLPPGHFGSLHEAYQQYFLRPGTIKFSYNSMDFVIEIKEVLVVPQCLSAVTSIMDEIAQQTKTLIIDIGGWTLDYLIMRHGDLSLDESGSLEQAYGTIHLYNTVRERFSNEFSTLLSESDVDLAMRGQKKYSDHETEVLKGIALNHATSILDRLHEKGLDIKSVTDIIFCGGGSILLVDSLKKALSNYDNVNIRFIEDIHANAKGYAEILRMRLNYE